MKALPYFSLSNGCFRCNNHVIDIHRRPMTIRLLNAFIARPSEPITKKELIDHVYGHFTEEELSERYRGTLAQNITKLISRTRIMLEEKVNGSEEKWIEFFIYDPNNESWSFYRLDVGFVRQILWRRRAS